MRDSRKKGGGDMTGVMVLADDLSGAAEVAGIVLERTTNLELSLSGVDGLGAAGRLSATVGIVDLDTRSRSTAEAGTRLSAALDAVPTGTRVVVKIDSLLRGHVAATVDVLARRGRVVVAAGHPGLGRVVRDGVLFVNHVPLHRSSVWNAEPGHPPATVRDVVGTAPSVAVPDVTGDRDLDDVVASVADDPDAVLVGSGALAAAVVRTLPAVDAAADTTTHGSSRDVLTVVGTASVGARDQVARLAEDGVPVVSVDAAAIVAGRASTAELESVLARGSAVLTVSGPLDPSASGRLVAALGQFVARVVAGRSVDLALTGGETARAVVDALGITTLRPVGRVHYGAVVLRAPDGRRVVTRPGSFGDRHSLSAIHAHLAGLPVGTVSQS
ncbi:four-carbon acid sugar kinase family protein [Rhodococcoides corynebacterioides]|uniref:four-carbon acid sugar kinase family protein n=1 Tax=Rhodococcoides corynebacterioides TaxID=53972 RepID=UPI0021C202F5|nr:four-carbon acid sugar kinase family protein [Rhodococcus corynebacterioides]MBY6350434.1 four-carbon acid sugar kinase family protein [Rhodococcus corynebacterioides]